MKIKTQEQADEFMDNLRGINAVGDIVYDYSGRNMFGKTCMGFDGEDEIAILMEIGRNNLPRPRIDNMGKGIIVYWPDILTDGENIIIQP